MRSLRRPMFRYGGDVKAKGVMHGMKNMQDGGPATMADATGLANGGMPNMRGRVTGPGGYAGNETMMSKAKRYGKTAAGTVGTGYGLELLYNLQQAGLLGFKNGGVARQGYKEGTLVDELGNVLKKTIKTNPVKAVGGTKIKAIQKGIPYAKNIYDKAKNFFNIQTVPKFQRANPYAKVGLRGPIDKIPFLQRVKDFAKLNPKATYGTLGVGVTSGSLPNVVGTALEGVGNIGLQAADLAISDKIFDQDKVIGSSVKDIYGRVRKKLGFEDKKDTGEGGTGKVPDAVINPPKSQAEIDAKTKADEDIKLKRIYKLLGVDSAQRNAASKALADVSRYIDEGGKDTISKKNIGSTLTKGILAFDKRLDKVDQLKEAAGLLLAKGEIAGMSDPLGKELKKAQLDLTNQKLKPGVADSISNRRAIKKGALTEQETIDGVRSGAVNEGLELLGSITSDQIDDGNYKGKTVIDIVTDLKPEKNGYFVIGKSIIKIESGVPKLIEGPLAID